MEKVQIFSNGNTIWFILGILVGTAFVKSKIKIDKTTAAGKAMDVVSRLATYAVHEADSIEGLSGAGKRMWAEQAVSQGLDWFGIKDVTPIAINGAIEKAVAEKKKG